MLFGLTAVVVLGLGHVHGTNIGFYDFTSSFRFSWSVAYVIGLSVAAYAVGLPDLPRDAYQLMTSALVAATAAAVGISLIQLALGSQLLPRFVVFWSVVFLVPLWTLTGFTAAHGRRRQSSRDRVLVVGREDEIVALECDLDRAPERHATVVARLQPECRPEEVTLSAEEERVTVVVLSRESLARDDIVAAAADLHERGLRVRTLSLFYDGWLGKLPVTELERVALMFDIGELHRARYGRAKRCLDILLGVAVLPIVIAITPLVLAGNLVANRGPLLFVQRRVGRWGDEFAIVKFRTMHPSADAATWTQQDDPRVTPFGRLLRRTHLDELPQVYNLLRGDLSVVGPRPEQPEYVRDLTEKIPFYRLRHLVRPGLTGWAQVKYAYGATDQDAVEKLQYEFWYLRHQGLALDARIIGRTVRTLVDVSGR